MNPATGPDSLPGFPSELHGRATRRLDNGHCWLEVLAGGGPRIVGFGLTGGPNLLAETPEASWDAGFGTFELVGGHRLWFAPETSECSVPDSTGLELTAVTGGIRMTGSVEAPTGLRKSIEVRLDPDSAAASLRHTIRNEGRRTLELSVWPITQLKLGGVATAELPVRPQERSMAPNRLVAMWPYASWSDDRFAIGDRELSVQGRPGDPFKVGCRSTAGLVGYLREGVLFVKRFDPHADSPHADLGCNLEVYVDQGTIELESLGPLVRIAPGASATHDERWELRLLT